MIADWADVCGEHSREVECGALLSGSLRSDQVVRRRVLHDLLEAHRRLGFGGSGSSSGGGADGAADERLGAPRGRHAEAERRRAALRGLLAHTNAHAAERHGKVLEEDVQPLLVRLHVYARLRAIQLAGRPSVQLEQQVHAFIGSPAERLERVLHNLQISQLVLRPNRGIRRNRLQQHLRDIRGTVMTNETNDYNERAER